jgi:transposase
MATAKEVSTSALVETRRSSDKPKRRQWPEALKRRIVTESLAAGALVSVVARRHDVNASQVFKWRREMAVEEPPAEAASVGSIAMLPVEIVLEANEAGRPERVRRSGTIEITFACGARVCVRGEVPPERLQQVIELLR